MRYAAMVCGLFLAAHVGAAEKLVLVAGGDKAGLKEPFGLDFLADGNMVLVEYTGHKVMRIDRDGTTSNIAGTGVKGFVDGPPEKAQFNGPHNLAVAKDGTIYVADTMNHAVRRIDARTRLVTTIAGSGKAGSGGDGGPAAKALFNQAYHVALDHDQTHLYVVDLGNRRIRRINLGTGIIETVAGNGEKGVPANGAKAIAAPLVDPRACALDKKGSLYILERGGHALRVVRDGAITTIAGTGKAGSTGDGGRATDASLNGPKFLWIDRQGDVLIADTENHVIRKFVAAEGSILRIAGTGKKGGGEPGEPHKTDLARPHGVAEGPDGTIYIVDSENARVLKLVK